MSTATARAAPILDADGSASPQRRGRLTWVDALVALTLCAGIAGYLALLPHSLRAADEANYLYDAKRVLNGSVTYRDYFTVITPGSMYFMAALFWLFGTTIDTARAGAAGLHGVMAALVYLTCRRVGVRRGLSWPPALAQLVVAQTAWPIASQHWLSTFFCVLLLFVCTGRRRQQRTWPFLPGVVLGLLVAVQQQRGLSMVAGTVAWLLVDAVLQRRYPPRPPGPPLVTQLVWLSAGTLAVMLPLGIHMIVIAGFDPVWQALVIFPLFNYRNVTHCEWGHINLMTAWQGSFTFPRALKYLPAILAVSVPRLLVRWLRRQQAEEVATLTLLVVFCLTSMLSIAYFPDFIHIAFIAPAFFVTIAESLEWGARQLPPQRRLVRAAGAVAGTALLIACVIRLHHIRIRLQAEFPFSRMTAFGRIDLRTANEVAIHDRLRELLQQTPSRYLYVYPGLSHLYLMLDVDNPTPWGFYTTSFHGPERFQQTLRELTVKQPPYILIVAALVAPDDPLVAWVNQHYEPIADDGAGQQLIFRIGKGTADG